MNTSPLLPAATLDLSIIIVSYNTADLTIQTITSALAACQYTSPSFSAEILVVDNNSHDDTLKKVSVLTKSSAIPITIIANKSNKGFATANNQAILQSKGRAVLLLNSDTIVAPQSLGILLSTFIAYPDNDSTADLRTHSGQIDRLGIVAATLTNPDGTPQPQGGSFPTLWSLFTHMTGLDDLPIIGQLLPSTQHTGKRAVSLGSTSTDYSSKNHHQPHLHVKDWVGGTAMLIRRSVIEEIGLLDENIFMYGEDVEYCMRAKQHHWDIAEVIDAPISHLGSASGSSARAIIGELTGYLYIWSKHKPHWQYPLSKAIILLGCQLRSLLFGTIGKQTAKAQVYRQAIQTIYTL
jgi:GT2 family glycosyltransferase